MKLLLNCEVSISAVLSVDIVEILNITDINFEFAVGYGSKQLQNNIFLSFILFIVLNDKFK